MEVYLLIMEEIKTRLNILSWARHSNLPFGQAREVCILQLRHICELIAIGCLAALGRLTGSNSMLNEDNPVKIMRELDRTWPHAFPQPATVSSRAGKVEIDANMKPNALTRKEAEQMWAKTGHYLHRLTIKKFFVPDPGNQPDRWQYIDTQVAKIQDLLFEHIIAIQKDQMLLVNLRSGPSGKCMAQLMKFDSITKAIIVKRFTAT